MTKKKAARTNLMVVTIALVIVVLVGGIAWFEVRAIHAARTWTQRGEDTLLTIQDLNATFRQAESGQRDFLLTGREDYLRPYLEATDHISSLTRHLDELVVGQPEQQQRVKILNAVLDAKLDELARTIALRRAGGLHVAMQVILTDVGRNYTVEIVSLLDAMTRVERAALEAHQEALERRVSIMNWLVASVTILGVMSLIWTARTMHRLWASTYLSETRERLAAQHLRTSLDSLTQGVGVFSSDNVLVNWNGCFIDLLEFSPNTLHVGAAYADICDDVNARESAPRQPAPRDENLSRNREEIADDIIVLNSGRYLEIRRSRLPDGGFVVTVTDATKRVQADTILRESQKMQAIGQLTGGVAHDFNNLLTVVLGNLELCQAKLSDRPDLLKKIERASWAARRGATLTSQLLAFARRQPLSPTAIDLNQSLPELVPMFQRTLGAHIDVSYVAQPHLWPTMADAAQLENAVLNLVLNARDAMPDGGALTIEVANAVLDENYTSLQSDVTPGDYTMIAVTDTGHGIPRDVLTRVFEPFFTTKSEGRGTGLGLAMVFGFVKQSGGHIQIYSEINNGTVVRLYLPRAADNEGAQTTQPAPPSPAILARQSSTVFVVDDDDEVREVTTAILRGLGYTTIEASSGEDGYQQIERHHADIDLLLTDVMLPGTVRGHDIAAFLKKYRADVPVLFMSGYTENAFIHQGKFDEGIELIAKPFTRAQLGGRIATLLQPAHDEHEMIPG